MLASRVGLCDGVIHTTKQHIMVIDRQWSLATIVIQYIKIETVLVGQGLYVAQTLTVV